MAYGLVFLVHKCEFRHGGKGVLISGSDWGLAGLEYV